MAGDPLKEARAKAKYVLEVRYEPLMQAFDRRGAVLEKLFPLFGTKAKHWRVQNVAVAFADDFDRPMRLLEVGHLSSRILYEDPGTYQEFIDDSLRFIGALGELFPQGLLKVNRIGFRAMTVLKHKTASSFEEVFRDIRKRFLSENLPLSLTFTDCSVILEQEHCRILVGPVQKGENWLETAFTRPELKDLSFGIALDVDSFNHEVESADSRALIEIARTLQQFSLTAEQETLRGMV